MKGIPRKKYIATESGNTGLLIRVKKRVEMKQKRRVGEFVVVKKNKTCVNVEKQN